MRFLTLSEVLALHRRILEGSGGGAGIRDLGAIESALSQPKMTIAGHYAYPSLVEKAGALCFSLIRNHAFVDGNKRIAHAAMEVFLVLNGMEIAAGADEQERFMLALAAGEISRESLIEWLQANVLPLDSRES